jgi:uncharacterized protein (TIGR02265 family)
MTQTRTIPGNMVAGLFQRILAADLSPALVGQLNAIGVDVSAEQPSEYQREVWYRAVEVTADALFPEVPQGDRLRKLGTHIISCLQSRNIVKGAWLTMARFMGPRRALKQAMEWSDRSPIRLTITELSKQEFEIAVDDDAQPQFLEGLLEGAIGLLGGQAAAVTLLGSTGESNVFRATWR